jgi:hypothetical protein
VSCRDIGRLTGESDVSEGKTDNAGMDGVSGTLIPVLLRTHVAKKGGFLTPDNKRLTKKD